MVLHDCFHLFNSLPAEIRRAIWIEALSQPRVIKIIGPHQDPINRFVQMGVDTGPTIPSTAMACSEAYDTLKEAFPCLAVPHHNSPRRVWAFPKDCILFLDGCDTVQVDSFTLAQVPGYTAHIDRITQVAISLQGRSWPFTFQAMGRMSRICPNLRKILLIHENGAASDENIRAMITTAMSRDGGNNFPRHKLQIKAEFQIEILDLYDCYFPEWPRKPELLILATVAINPPWSPLDLVSWPLPPFLQYTG
ncbi:hypothetical protein CGRA01v4_07344 [Colletotrichum graminicola]|uniref:2EXR domain-containing protein n=1 Tax=Colletotrichum graminicola (strain M1.001 / M2 / FGSC 10212) TaxID=645133 RepID=E3QC92_COLGM|nr:uncharacterized protein GLRG_03624 [Colletotrichum graminicola M1.001]EFQ28480.1 hypothetical protein GLRG_03624 [Colletotrichum graminicola M1.001]WDK16063.1 hypothetical protein CGRA01v4_07344 [Colletotrichum graminicola]